MIINYNKHDLKLQENKLHLYIEKKIENKKVQQFQYGICEQEQFQEDNIKNLIHNYLQKNMKL